MLEIHCKCSVVPCSVVWNKVAKIARGVFVSNFRFEEGKGMLRTGLYSQLVTAISPTLFHLILILYNEEANTGGQWTEGRRRPILSPPFRPS
jgi:hypothetical protein